MKEAFRQIPAPLQSAILFRLAGCLLGVLMLIFALISGSNWPLMVPGIILFLCALASASVLFRQYQQGTILCIEGICTSLERTAVRKRIQAISLKSGQHDVKLICQHRQARNIAIGDHVTVYLKENAAVYDAGDQQVICDYILMKKGRTPENKLAH